MLDARLLGARHCCVGRVLGANCFMIRTLFHDKDTVS
jgi:hypothetical protein